MKGLKPLFLLWPDGRSDMTKMTSNRPYLVRAMYDWIVDNNCTPHMVVDASYPGVRVPQQHVSGGQIVLNVAPRAISNFSMDLKAVGFSTRFGGVPAEIYFPMAALLGIYARENGHGLMFGAEDNEDSHDPDDEGPKPPSSPEGGGRPTLKVIK